MLTIEQLKKEFISQGYTAQSAKFHAECKYKADIYFDVNIKNPRRYISPANSLPNSSCNTSMPAM